MSAPASPMKPAKVPKPDKLAPPPPPKVVAPAVEEDEDDLPPPEDDPDDEVPAVSPPPKPIVMKPSNSPPPPPPPKAAKAAPLSSSPVPSETIEPTVDRKGVKSFVNPALAGKANSVPKPARTASPTPPPRVTSAPAGESEKSEETTEESAKRGSIFTSMSHGLRKALRNSLIATGGDGNSSPAIVDENVLKEGQLSKMNREGKFEKYKIVLRKDEFFYTQDKDATGGAHDDEGDGAAATTGTSSSASAAAASEHDRHEIPLVSMIILELHDKDLVESEKRNRCFKLLSKTKSFYLRAKTEELKNEWYQEMFNAVKAAHEKANVTLQLEDMAPLWNTGDPNCQLCGKAFSFFTRKHHCRNCGKCVCELCSRDKVRILRIDEKKLFKVCNPCGEEIKNNRRYGV